MAKTLVVILEAEHRGETTAAAAKASEFNELAEENQKLRITNVTKAAEFDEDLVALDEMGNVRARFKRQDVRSWYLE